MVLAVAPDKWPALRTLCREWNVEATDIGCFSGNGRLVVRYDGQVVADLDMTFLHDGVPKMTLLALRPERPRKDAGSDAPEPAIDLSKTLLALLAHPDIASKEDIIRRYDHEVGAGTLVKPLTGSENDGPSDAVVLKPMQTWRHNKGLVLSLGVNPQIGKADPYAMAVSAVDEAMRNAVAVGADPDQIALLDNFCWGGPRRPEQMGSLVRAAQGCYDAALAYGAPFISGKDSLNNEYLGADGERIPIPGTLLISALGIIPDVRTAVTMDLKEPGNVLLMVGETRNELAGSHVALAAALDVAGSDAPMLPECGLDLYRNLHRAIQNGLVRACHDLSEGGLAVAAAEMCIAGRLGMTLHVDQMPVTGVVGVIARLFGETNGRFLVEVRPDHVAAWRQVVGDCPVTEVGVVEGSALRILGDGGAVLVDVPVADLSAAWQGGAA